jgi:hypothetical protein
LKKLLVIVASASALAFASVAVAHTFFATPSLTIHKAPVGATSPGATVIVYGRIISGRSFCRANRVVRLFRVRPGPDRLQASDITDREGEYIFIRHPRRDQRVYTRIRARSSTSYGHSHNCAADRSRNRFINVTGS